MMPITPIFTARDTFITPLFISPLLDELRLLRHAYADTSFYAITLPAALLMLRHDTR